MLKIDNIVKRYGRTEVLHGISFCVHLGEIVGFVGPNGAGKTTTLKIATGLIRPDSGTVSINGFDIAKETVQALSCATAMIEGPSLFQDLTGKDHMDFVANLRKVSKAQVDKCLEIADLGVWLKRPVRKYSLGMKQRLGLALCLLPQPKLLLLDEPTNGLDPNAMLELREMLLHLRAVDNTAILFSSHMLSEVEKIADRVVCIRKGELVDSSSLQMPVKYALDVDDPRAAMEVLSRVAAHAAVELGQGGHISITPSGDSLNAIFAALIQNGISIRDIKSESDDLESQYRDLYLRRDTETR